MTEKIGEHIKAVIFDHDDTLVGTYSAKIEQHQHIAREHYDKELSEGDIRAHWGKPVSEFLCLLYDTEDVDQAVAHTITYRDRFPKKLFAATIPTLKRLKHSGMLVGIVTSTIRDNLEHDLKTHQVPRDLIDYVQTLEDTDYHKPDPRVFQPTKEWLKERDVSPGEVVYIGDGIQDMQAAIGSGFSFIGVQTGIITAEQFRAHGAKSVTGLDKLT